MAKHIAYSNPDGSMAIVTPAPGVALELVQAKDVPADAKDVRIIDTADIPKDRIFRNAWRLKSGKVQTDLLSARDLLREKMRVARKPLLEALDVEYMIADEADDAELKSEIAAEKQALRDVTELKAIEVATTPEELKATWPEALLGPLTPRKE